eukprot:906790-Prymnesium_polylepis.2
MASNTDRVSPRPSRTKFAVNNRQEIGSRSQAIASHGTGGRTARTRTGRAGLRHYAHVDEHARTHSDIKAALREGHSDWLRWATRQACNI